jgi:hypothetical protein
VRREPGEASAGSTTPATAVPILRRHGARGQGARLSGLAAGHSLVVHDLRREAAANLLAACATWAESPRTAAAQCETPGSAKNDWKGLRSALWRRMGSEAGEYAKRVYGVGRTGWPLVYRL